MMSLAKTLMKVVIGVAIAKGVSALAKGNGSGAKVSPKPATVPSAGRGARYDGGRGGSAKGGLDDLMADVLGQGRSSTKSARTVRSGDLLDEITGPTRRRPPRKSAPKGGLDGVLDSLSPSPSRGGTSFDNGGLGDLLGAVLGGTAARPTLTPQDRETEISAALMLRAVIQAVKCDGTMDAAEKQKLMEAMGDATAAEVRAVNAELERPVDVDALASLVPEGLEAQVYLASLSAIDLDSQPEAEYLHALAQVLELAEHEVNALHDRAGAPHIYR